MYISAKKKEQEKTQKRYHGLCVKEKKIDHVSRVALISRLSRVSHSDFIGCADSAVR